MRFTFNFKVSVGSNDFTADNIPAPPPRVDPPR
uniref:Uncharacterized protein MANES_11G023500 n=1 Tax=Rhizophora mucronata TaxID=61149 RepID=A0A2P2K493_RHIMU